MLRHQSFVIREHGATKGQLSMQARTAPLRTAERLSNFFLRRYDRALTAHPLLLVPQGLERMQ